MIRIGDAAITLHSVLDCYPLAEKFTILTIWANLPIEVCVDAPMGNLEGCRFLCRELDGNTFVQSSFIGEAERRHPLK